MTLPAAALAKLRAIRATLPITTRAPKPGKRGKFVLVTHARHLPSNERAKPEPVVEARKLPAATTKKRTPWPDPGGVRWAFEEARRKR